VQKNGVVWSIQICYLEHLDLSSLHKPLHVSFWENFGLLPDHMLMFIIQKISDFSLGNALLILGAYAPATRFFLKKYQKNSEQKFHACRFLLKTDISCQNFLI
jgi:hypothetical protein